MKKHSLFIGVVSNVIIAIVIFGLYVACVPTNFASAFAPIYQVETKENKVAIMVNVYEGSEYVEKILDITARYDAVCTFFVGGVWAEKNHSLLKRMSEEAELGNHGYLHRDHAKLSQSQNREEIVLCEKLVEKITGVKTYLFAPPSGSFNDAVLTVCERLDYKVIMWSKDTIDWRDKDFQLIYSRATKDVKSGDMILMHPTEQTVKALPLVLEHYAKLNLRAVTVTELLYGQNSF